MNEKIRKFVEQTAHGDIDQISAVIDINKFAELIVKECAAVCLDQAIHYYETKNPASASSGASVCETLIKMHFGVK